MAGQVAGMVEGGCQGGGTPGFDGDAEVVPASDGSAPPRVS
ncbi:hypothetical protein [Actinoplanes sp. NBRC 103695]|nr:hypothetical protein [Actinoplanes sp. NBRC 103695]